MSIKSNFTQEQLNTECCLLDERVLDDLHDLIVIGLGHGSVTSYFNDSAVGGVAGRWGETLSEVIDDLESQICELQEEANA